MKYYIHLSCAKWLYLFKINYFKDKIPNCILLQDIEY
jgi:hypothetical protein